MTSKNQLAICFDLERTFWFLRSVAQARAMQQYTRVEWQTYRESAVINGLYKVMFWKEPPGTAELVSDDRKINAETERYLDHYLDVWLGKVAGSPIAGVRYLEGMQEIRKDCLESVHSTIADAQQINREVLGETNKALRTLGGIKLASTIGVAGLGAFVVVPGSVLLVPAINMGYGVSCAIAGSLGQATSAQVVAISVPVATGVGGEATKMGLDKTASTFRAKTAAQQEILDKASRKVQQYSNRLAKTGLSRGARKTANRNLRTAAAQLDTAASAANRAGQVARVSAIAAKGTPVVFAALDVLLEAREYMQLWESTE